MPPFNEYISRDDAEALIPEETSAEIFKSLAETFWLFRMARRLPNMARGQTRLPVMSALATAGFVSANEGLKPTSDVNWTDKYVDAEEIAAVVPISQAVLDDADYDIWAEVRPAIEEAFSVVIAQAVLHGTNIPATWTTNLGGAGLVAQATAAGNVASVAAFTDIYSAVLGESVDGAGDGMVMLLEADGFMPTGHLAAIPMKGRLRNCRDSDGNPIFMASPQDAARYVLDGADCYFPLDGSINAALALMIGGDWSKLVYSMRQDMTYSIADQAVISDAAGNIVVNLWQQDMVALRCVMRIGFTLPNPVNRVEPTEGNRSPFTILTP